MADKPGIEIVSTPRYAAVMRFESCRNLRFEGFTAGHTDGAGTCTGAVLNFANCTDVEVDRCDLYGCGTYGVELELLPESHRPGQCDPGLQLRRILGDPVGRCAD